MRGQWTEQGGNGNGKGKEGDGGEGVYKTMWWLWGGIKHGNALLQKVTEKIAAKHFGFHKQHTNCMFLTSMRVLTSCR